MASTHWLDVDSTLIKDGFLVRKKFDNDELSLDSNKLLEDVSKAVENCTERKSFQRGDFIVIKNVYDCFDNNVFLWDGEKVVNLKRESSLSVILPSWCTVLENGRKFDHFTKKSDTVLNFHSNYLKKQTPFQSAKIGVSSNYAWVNTAIFTEPFSFRMRYGFLPKEDFLDCQKECFWKKVTIQGEEVYLILSRGYWSIQPLTEQVIFMEYDKNLIVRSFLTRTSAIRQRPGVNVLITLMN